MNRRTYLEGVGAAVATGALAGCAGDGADDGNGGGGDDTGNGRTDGEGTDSDETAEYGILSTAVTDQPNDIGDFESLVVTIEGIWVKPVGSDRADGGDDPDAESGDENATVSDDAPDTTDEEDANTTDDEDPGDDEGDEETDDEGEDDDEGGDEGDGDDAESSDDQDDAESGEENEGDAARYYIEFEDSQEADLVELQGDDTQLIDETELEVGDYQFLQLNVSETTGTLTSGEEAKVETPGNAPLQFKQAFEIRPEERTRFIADFAPFRRGNGEYLIRPVASGTQVLYGDEAPDGGADTDGDTDDTPGNGGPDNPGGGSGDIARPRS